MKSPRVRSIAFVGVPLLLCVVAAAAWADCKPALSAEDAAAIRKVIESYRTSWLAGDSKGVLATLTPDAVLMPAHGCLLQRVAEAAAIGPDVALGPRQYPALRVIFYLDLGCGQYNTRQSAEGEGAGYALNGIAAGRSFGKMRYAKRRAIQRRCQFDNRR